MNSGISYFYLRLNYPSWLISNYDILSEDIHNLIPMKSIRFSINVDIDDEQYIFSAHTEYNLDTTKQNFEYEVDHSIYKNNELKLEGSSRFNHNIKDEYITYEEINHKINDILGISINPELHEMIRLNFPSFTKLANLNIRNNFMYYLCESCPHVTRCLIEDINSCTLPEFHKSITSQELKKIYDFYVINTTHEE